ncbi:MAG: hypothetical protein IJJ38_10655 [Lachnospiraceae bacterium]|nr:hypothetical protein [Lachnospiraceae bacterium]
MRRKELILRGITAAAAAALIAAGAPGAAEDIRAEEIVGTWDADEDPAAAEVVVEEPEEELPSGGDEPVGSWSADADVPAPAAEEPAGEEPVGSWSADADVPAPSEEVTYEETYDTWEEEPAPAPAEEPAPAEDNVTYTPSYVEETKEETSGEEVKTIAEEASGETEVNDETVKENRVVMEQALYAAPSAAGTGRTELVGDTTQRYVPSNVKRTTGNTSSGNSSSGSSAGSSSGNSSSSGSSQGTKKPKVTTAAASTSSKSAKKSSSGKVTDTPGTGDAGKTLPYAAASAVSAAAAAAAFFGSRRRRDS